ARPAGGEQHVAGPGQGRAATAVPHQGAAATAFVVEQVDREAVLPDACVGPGPGLEDHGTHQLAPGRVPQRMDDPGVRVSPFAGQGDLAVDLVEVRPPLDQLGDPPGRLADDQLDDLGV